MLACVKKVPLKEEICGTFNLYHPCNPKVLHPLDPWMHFIHGTM